MIETNCGIVLHTKPHTEDCFLVWIYTEQRGIMVFAAKKSKSRQGSMHTSLLRILNIVDITYEYKTNSKFQKLKSIQIRIPLVSIPYHPIKGSIAMFLAESLYYSLRNEATNANLFKYLIYSIQWLDNRQDKFANYHLVFLIRMTRFLGFWPSADDWFPQAHYDLLNCRYISKPSTHGNDLLPEEAKILPYILRMNYSTMHRFKFNHLHRKRILDVILQFYQIHLSEFPSLKSIQVLHEVLS